MGSSGDPQLIAWLGDATDPRVQLLRHFGLELVLSPGSQSVEASILPLTLRGVAEPPTGPALLLVDTAEQEAQWLAQLPAEVDLLREPASALLIYERLRRLMQRLPKPALWAEAAPLDPLTGCLGRAGWTRQLQQRLAQPSGEASALMLIDLDGFRSFNEQHGHVAGDWALSELTRRCRATLGPHDVLGRWSGDTFALLLQRYDTDGLLHDAQRLLTLFASKPLAPPDPARLARWLKPAAPALSLTGASAGLAWLGGAAGFAELLSEADAALQQAKRQGGARLVLAARSHPAPQRAAAQTDPISQLPNRAYCDARLARESQAADREGWPLALWLVDLRGLAELNALQGHAEGDQALLRLARAIGEQARLVDWTARVRASALTVVMPRTDADGAQRAAQRLRGAMSGLGLPLSDCLVQRHPGESAADLLARAWQQRRPLLQQQAGH